MKIQPKKLLKIGMLVLAVKVLLVACVLLAVYSGGLSSLQTLWLGVEVLPVDDTIRTQFAVKQSGGVLVDHVFEHSPADNAGLKRGDVLLNLDNAPIQGPRDVEAVLKGKRFKDSLPVVYSRDGATFSARLVLDYRATQASAGKAPSVYRYRITPVDFFELFILGLVAGVLSGMIGCGGGVLKVSLLITFFGFEIFLAKALSLVSCGFMSIASSSCYVKENRVDREALVYLIPSAALGALVGVFVSMFLDRHVLEVALGLFLIYAAVDVGYQTVSDLRRAGSGGEAPANSTAQRETSALVFAGFPTGLASAILGITGGVISTPLQRFLLKTPIKTCIANTLATVIFASFLGGGLLLIEGIIRDYFSIRTFVFVLLALMPGSVIGGRAGAMLNGKLPTGYVKATYAAVILFVAVRILIYA